MEKSRATFLRNVVIKALEGVVPGLKIYKTYEPDKKDTYQAPYVAVVSGVMDFSGSNENNRLSGVHAFRLFLYCGLKGNGANEAALDNSGAEIDAYCKAIEGITYKFGETNLYTMSAESATMEEVLLPSDVAKIQTFTMLVTLYFTSKPK